MCLCGVWLCSEGLQTLQQRSPEDPAQSWREGEKVEQQREVEEEAEAPTQRVLELDALTESSEEEELDAVEETAAEAESRQREEADTESICRCTRNPLLEFLREREMEPSNGGDEVTKRQQRLEAECPTPCYWK